MYSIRTSGIMQNNGYYSCTKAFRTIESSRLLRPGISHLCPGRTVLVKSLPLLPETSSTLTFLNQVLSFLSLYFCLPYGAAIMFCTEQFIRSELCKRLFLLQLNTI
ncbi:hypothetical protein ANANG_G00122760 [Anguilla anguilla]|uniref:Uncharacterized protein n=1 Tax=Anguilla anguilla TaxID=7936 RepID=A0A9D3MDS9_ANGAN|nr:hypothetical protein ANANG_G00122760 [Anguilla anguilla]